MEWMPLMIEHGIPAGPINNLEDVFNDPQVLACGIVQSANHPKVGQLKQVGLPVNLSNMNGEGSVRTAPPLFGQHTASVFSDFGRSEEHTSELQSLMRISYAVFCLTKNKLQTTSACRTTHRNDYNTN